MTPETPSARPWDTFLRPEDHAVLARGGFARRMGFGRQTAILAIDCQRYMVGERGVEDEGHYPSSCGAVGWAAVDWIATILSAARTAAIPVFLTRFELDPSGNDIGVYARKRGLLDRSDWCLADTPGAALLQEVGPVPGDIVLIKKKPSAFFGTPLLSMLIDCGVDTVVVVGGATSNCVRATVLDAASNNLRAIVPADAVFDRFPISHAISLFDMDRQFADVMDAAEVVSQLARA